MYLIFNEKGELIGNSNQMPDDADLQSRGEIAQEYGGDLDCKITFDFQSNEIKTTPNPPDAYHVWNEAKGTWETSAELQAAKLDDWRANVAEITPKQLRLVLLENGINAKAVETAIASIHDETTREVAGIEWNYATGYARNNENLMMIATQLLGLSEEEIDAMWLDALTK